MPFGPRSGLASSSYFFGFFLSAFAPPSRPGLVTGMRTFSSLSPKRVVVNACARRMRLWVHPTLSSWWGPG